VQWFPFRYDLTMSPPPPFPPPFLQKTLFPAFTISFSQFPRVAPPRSLYYVPFFVASLLYLADLLLFIYPPMLIHATPTLLHLLVLFSPLPRCSSFTRPMLAFPLIVELFFILFSYLSIDPLYLFSRVLMLPFIPMLFVVLLAHFLGDIFGSLYTPPYFPTTFILAPPPADILSLSNLLYNLTSPPQSPISSPLRIFFFVRPM